MEKFVIGALPWTKQSAMKFYKQINTLSFELHQTISILKKLSIWF